MSHYCYSSDQLPVSEALRLLKHLQHLLSGASRSKLRIFTSLHHGFQLSTKLSAAPAAAAPKLPTRQERRDKKEKRRVKKEKEEIKRRQEVEMLCRLGYIQSKKPKPSHEDVGRVLVTYHGLMQQRRGIERNFPHYRRLLADHQTGSICHRKLERYRRFRHKRSPLRRELRVRKVESAQEETKARRGGPTSLWGSVKEFLWNVWTEG
ncbi:hypothetical protein N7535_008115 [Penicillium sp. DV-2018c]|nr:hypothetical protein N7535_008115 [Penicillium sp. DV-2018c]